MKTLILDNNKETGLFHSFLLTLSGHRVTEVRSPADALNRLITASRGRDPYSLLVISNYPSSPPFDTFLESLREGGCGIPVLVFRRPRNPASYRLSGVAWCMPDDALEAISALRPDRPLPAGPLPAVGPEPSQNIRLLS